MTAIRNVAVTGLGAVTPYGKGWRALLSGLAEERCPLRPLTMFRTSLDLPPTVGEINDALYNDHPNGEWWSRTDRLAVTAAREAWTSAGLDDEARGRCAAVVATTVAGLSDIGTAAACDPIGYYRSGGLSPVATFAVSHPADAVAGALKLGGPSLGVSVACASGAVAVADAARRIVRGETAVALAAGTDALCEFTLAGFQSLQALDPDPCRPFDRSRRGLNLGEGAAAVVLEDLAAARARGARVFAVLSGWAVSNDAFHPTAPDEQGRGLAGAMRDALAMAKVDVGDIGYVNAHGTGTLLNDVAETAAYDLVFGSRSTRVPVSSTKAYLGHTLGAAGAIEAVITILALVEQRLFPTLRLCDPVPSSAVDWLTTGGREARMEAAMSVSAGFGGSNAALVFETADRVGRR